MLLLVREMGLLFAREDSKLKQSLKLQRDNHGSSATVCSRIQQADQGKVTKDIAQIFFVISILSAEASVHDKQNVLHLRSVPVLVMPGKAGDWLEQPPRTRLVLCHSLSTSHDVSSVSPCVHHQVSLPVTTSPQQGWYYYIAYQQVED